MTQRNNHPQTLQAMPTGMPEALRVAPGLAPITVAILVLVLINLITVLTGAGFGYV